MSGPGSQVIGGVQLGPQLIADGDNQFFKAGGITIAWALVAPMVGAGTFPGGIKYADGEKWIRVGTPLVLLTAGLYAGFYAPLTAGVIAGAAAPTLTTPADGGSTLAGDYDVGFTYVTAAGETGLSATSRVRVAAGNRITVGALAGVPAGVTQVNYYISPANTFNFRTAGNNAAGAAFNILALPAVGAAQPPTSVLNGQGTLTKGRVYLNNRTFGEEYESMTDYAPGGVLYGGLVWEKLIYVPTGFTLTHILAALPLLQTVPEDPI